MQGGDAFVFDAPDAECTHATEKAIKVLAPELGENEVWIPQSAVHEDSEVFQKGDTGTLVIKGWFAEQKGWL